MKNLTFAALTLLAFSPAAFATQADNTTVTVTAKTAGPTPFINNVSLTCSDPAALAGIKFTIARKQGSFARSLVANYPKGYLVSRGYFDSATGNITVPVFGLYAGYSNKVTLRYRFADGSSKSSVVTIATAAFDDPCDFNTPTVRQARTTTTALSYDYILVGSRCAANSPTVIDTDGNVRWVGSAHVKNYTTQFYDNAIYQADAARLLRIELDGAVTVIADYTSLGVPNIHHNIEKGKVGLFLSVNTPDWVSSVIYEVDPFNGTILRQWSLGDIISAAMTAGGDDPSGFVRKAQGRYDIDAPEDWFHNNSVVFRGADNTLLVSSRENFVIALDYKTKAIKWILGDTSKQWYQYPSLRKFALAVPAGGLAPDGQHTLSLTKDKNLLLFDNGQPSKQHQPQGPVRYSAPRKYQLDLSAKTATEVWSYPNSPTIRSGFCSSVYEDAANNYLIDYANVNNVASIFGLTAAGDKVFEYAYPTSGCDDAYRALPIHWENIMFTAPATAEAVDDYSEPADEAVEGDE
jgi:hypothetical protein